MKTVCVFCGSNGGDNPVYTEMAGQLGEFLGKKKITLVFGAGKVGLMGVVANAALRKGGKVIGVIPDFLKEKEVAHTGLSELYVVKTMHERKKIMADLSEGFIAMPGGFGTMDELCEILSWAQLGLHNHPVGLLNVEHFYSGLINLFDHMVREKFLHKENRAMLLTDTDPVELINKMINYHAPSVDKWMERAQI